MNKISVLIPSYNCVKFLPEAIKSVLNQTYQDFEIIIIDDGSTDNTKDIVDSFKKQYLNQIQYIYQENKGLAIARNTGLEHAQGQYIALLDADDVWLPERLEAEIHVIESDPSIGLVHANITKISPTGEFLDTPIRQKQFLSGNIYEYIFLRKADIACPTVLFRKECCKQAGMFDPNLTRLGCEDRDLWLRISKDYKITYVDKVLANYRVSPESMSRNLKKMLEARLYVIDKYCPKNDQSKRGLRNKALSKIFRDRGDELLLQKSFNNAHQEYQKAIEYDPFSFWTLVNWLKTILKQ